MMHENAYVASVSLSADVNQTVKVGNASKGSGFRVKTVSLRVHVSK